MAAVCEPNILMNDLLSFLTCKLKLLPKEKILNCINNYYSEAEIIEAQKALLTALPIKKSTRHGRRVKHPDPLIAIYDCIQLIQDDDLPLFVCKNLNNIPSLNMKPESKIKDCLNRSFQSIKQETIEVIEDTTDEEKIEIDEETCRQEQKEMRVQISKMKSIIEELKDEFQKFIDNPKSSNCPTKTGRETTLTKATLKKGIQESNTTPKDVDVDAGHSKLKGLALIQKLIDEEEAEQRDEFKESESEDSEVDEFDYMEDTFFPSKIASPHKSSSFLSKKSLPNNSTEMDHDQSSIYIQRNDQAFESNSESIEISALSDDMDDPIEDDEQGPSKNSKRGENNALKSGDPHQCPLCKKRFSSNFELRFHSKDHITESSYDCTMCGKSFTKRKSFLAHFFRCLEEKKAELKDHFCSICGSFYAEMSGLKTHRQVHSTNKPYSCDKCAYRFHSQALLTGHVNAQHNHFNKFSCSLCPLSYISKPYLLAHLRVHTGERPYKCDICSYRSGDRATFKNHLMRHAYHESMAANEKGFRFKCEFCTYASMFRPPFRKHMLSHPKKNAFASCPECFAPLVNQRAVFVHLRNYCKNNVAASKT